MAAFDGKLMLSSYRALDLTDEKGFLCGKILGDLGVDVIKVERPCGDPSRSIGPFYHDIPDPEKSLYWFAYNSNKRGITLNIETRDGQQLFKRLVKTADFVIESFPPGCMDSLGLGYAVLSEINPRIIMTSITPFGQTGPYKEYKASDIVVWAVSGVMYLVGDPDRPPVEIGFPQAYLHGSAAAAAGSLCAHYHREVTGEGQYVDVSAQQSAICGMIAARPSWEMNKIIQRRAGAFRAGLSKAASLRQTWPCRDGFVAFVVMGGAGGAPRSNRALVEWMDSKGMADDFVKSVDWDTLDFTMVTQEFHDRIQGLIQEFFMAHTMEELASGAVERNIMLCPVNDTRNIVEDHQLAARDFWQEVEHPELGNAIIYPGAFIKASETPCTIRRRAPLIGEHNEEVYQELGLSRDSIIILKQAGII